MMAIKKCISIAMILILKLHTWGLAAQSLLPQVTNDPIALDTSVRYGTLDNGFTYYIKKTQDPPRTICFKKISETLLPYKHLSERLTCQ